MCNKLLLDGRLDWRRGKAAERRRRGDRRGSGKRGEWGNRAKGATAGNSGRRCQRYTAWHLRHLRGRVGAIWANGKEKTRSNPNRYTN